MQLEVGKSMCCKWLGHILLNKWMAQVTLLCTITCYRENETCITFGHKRP